MNLGNCPKCQNKLAVVQRNKFRLVGDQRILLDEDGKDLRQEASGRLTGRPALEWVVSCSDCGRECRDHPYQKDLNALAAKQKATPPPAPAFMTPAHQEFTREADVEKRLGALEAALGRIEQLLTRKKGA